MMKKLTFFITFLLFMMLTAFLLWVSGYNFDNRNPDIAICIVIGLMFSTLFSIAITVVSNKIFKDEE